MLSGNCTEALSIQANVTISGSSAKLIKNGIAPLPFPLPALLQKYWYIKRRVRVKVRRHAPFYATLGLSQYFLYLARVLHAHCEGTIYCVRRKRTWKSCTDISESLAFWLGTPRLFRTTRKASSSYSSRKYGRADS